MPLPKRTNQGRGGAAQLGAARSGGYHNLEKQSVNREGGMSSKILVVDDNPTNLKLVTKLLERQGHKILQAVDAEEAQVVLADTLPELILMDVALPGMDGLTLARKLKADERTRHIRIVALTAFAMKGDDQKAFDAGCEGYITKPIDTRKLPGQVAELLAKPPMGGIPL
jgi:CheY-like chemotaxis protein